jgi:hypothetical protein
VQGKSSQPLVLAAAAFTRPCTSDLMCISDPEAKQICMHVCELVQHPQLQYEPQDLFARCASCHNMLKVFYMLAETSALLVRIEFQKQLSLLWLVAVSVLLIQTLGQL